LQKAQEYEQLAAEARAEAETVETDLITNIIEISDAAAERLTNAMEAGLKNAEKTKDIASTLGEIIETGNLTAIQKATLEAAGYDLSNWT
jgi:alanine dehydrogenase